MTAQSIPAAFFFKVARFECRNGNSKPFTQIGQVNTGYVKGIIADNLGRHKFIYFIQKFTYRLYFGKHIFSCCDIYNRNAKTVVNRNNSHQIIISGFI